MAEALPVGDVPPVEEVPPAIGASRVPYVLEKLIELDMTTLDDPTMITKLGKFWRIFSAFVVDQTSEDETLQIIRKMNYLYQSPQRAVKELAVKISSRCLKNLSVETMQKWFPIRSIPVVSLDTRILVKRYTNNFLISNLKELVTRAIQLFNTNVFDQEGSYLYCALMNVIDDDFQLWRHEVYPAFKERMRHMSPEGAFYQSMLKYWLPRTLTSFKEECYDVIMPEEFLLSLKLNVALWCRKNGVYVSFDRLEHYCGPVRKLIETDPTVTMSIICATNASILSNGDVLAEDFKYFSHYICLDTCRGPEVVFVRKFVGRIFACAHLNIDDADLIRKLFGFLKYIYYRGLFYVNIRKEIGGLMWQAIWDIATSDSSGLNIKGFPVDQAYPKESNEFLLFMLHQEPTKWWYNNMSSPYFGWKLYEFYRVTQLQSICDLIVNKCPVVYIPDYHVVMETLYTNFLNHLNINHLEYFRTFCRLLICIYGDSGVHKCFIFFTAKANEISAHDTILKYVAIDTLFVQILTLIDERYDIIACNLVRRFIDSCLMIIEVGVHRNLHPDQQKTLERFMIDTIGQISRFQEIYDFERIAQALVFIIQKCELKRPITEATKALKMISNKLGNCNSVRYDLLYTTINSLMLSDHIMLKIRKNPQTRLVIYALCFPVDNNAEALYSSMGMLIDLIEKSQTTPLGLAYTFTCLETLMNDVELQSCTFKYIGTLFSLCLNRFDTYDSLIQNSIVQLFSVLVTRILGSRASNEGRFYSFADVYPVHKQIFKYIINFCYTAPLLPGIRLVAEFFLEGQNRYASFEDAEFRIDMELIKDVFFSLLFSDQNKSLRMAAGRAFVSCLRFADIHSTISFLLRQDLRYYKEFELIMLNLINRYDDIHYYFSQHEKFATLKSICVYLHQNMHRIMYYMSDWDQVLSRVFETIDIEFLIKALQLASYEKFASAKEHFLSNLDVNTVTDLQGVVECRYFRVELPRVMFINAFKSRLHELKTKTDTERVLNSLALLALDDHTSREFTYFCADFIDLLLHKFREITFSPEVINIVSSNTQKILPQYYIMKLVQSSLTEISEEDMTYLLESTRHDIVQKKLTFDIRVELLYLIRLCAKESHYKTVFECMFLTLLFCNSLIVCLDPIYRLCGAHIHTRDEAFSALMNFEYLRDYLSREEYLHFLNICLTHMRKYLTGNDLVHYYSGESDVDVVRRAHLKCRQLIDDFDMDQDP